MPSVTKWMVGYGLFLILCGVAAWAVAGFESRAVTAIIVGGGTGVIAILLGLLSGAENRKAKMIGIHLGMVVIGIFAVMFAVVGMRRWGSAMDGDTPMYLPITITVMCLGSIVALVMVIRLRPPMEKRGENVGDPLE